jgi:hypothetical protein
MQYRCDKPYACLNSDLIRNFGAVTITYDHRIMRILLPVRSADIKHDTGGLVVRWVTTSEYLLLYVFAFLPFRFKLESESFCR